MFLYNHFEARRAKAEADEQLGGCITLDCDVKLLVRPNKTSNSRTVRQGCSTSWRLRTRVPVWMWKYNFLTVSESAWRCQDVWRGPWNFISTNQDLRCFLMEPGYQAAQFSSSHSIPWNLDWPPSYHHAVRNCARQQFFEGALYLVWYMFCHILKYSYYVTEYDGLCLVKSATMSHFIWETELFPLIAFVMVPGQIYVHKWTQICSWDEVQPIWNPYMTDKRSHNTTVCLNQCLSAESEEKNWFLSPQ